MLIYFQDLIVASIINYLKDVVMVLMTAVPVESTLQIPHHVIVIIAAKGGMIVVEILWNFVPTVQVCITIKTTTCYYSHDICHSSVNSELHQDTWLPRVKPTTSTKGVYYNYHLFNIIIIILIHYSVNSKLHQLIQQLRVELARMVWLL